MLPCLACSNGYALKVDAVLKSWQARITWLIRAGLALGALGLVFAALGSQTAAEVPQPTSTAMVVEAAPPTPPQPVATVRPTATSEPVVERIISRIARETQAPYPTSTPVPAGFAFVNVVDFAYLP